MSIQITLRNTHQLTLDDLVDLVPTSPAAKELAELRARPLPGTVESFTALDSTARSMALVPREITAESGHKVGMIGEFHEEVLVRCPDCDMDQPDPDCEICDGIMEYTETVAVSWTTIKAIHRRIVELSEQGGN